MALYSRIGEFDSAHEDWLSYTERLEQFFTANDIDDATKQRATLLSVCGASTYQLIRNLLAPAKPSSKSFKELVELVQKHLQPPPSVIVQRFTFHSRSRRQEESISEFVVELRKVAEHCEFGESLNDMLRDRLVCGINDQRLQRRLLSESKLSFSQALEIAQAAESADRNAKELGKAAGIHAVYRRTGSEPLDPPSAQTCYRCGGQHLSASCRFKSCVCHNCGKLGHLAKVCRSRKSQAEPKLQRGSPTYKEKRRPKEAHRLEEAGCEETTYSLFHTPGTQTHPIVVSLKLDQVETCMEVDTGASASIISEVTYRKLWPKERTPKLQTSSVRLRTYTGEWLKVLGSITVTVEYRGQREKLKLLVVSGSGPSLMGRDWLLKIRLD